MSDTGNTPPGLGPSPGPGWWLASDDRWYPPPASERPPPPTSQGPHPAPAAPPTWSTSEQAQKRISSRAERVRLRRAWWAGLGRRRQVVLVVVIAVLAVGLAVGVNSVDNTRTPPALTGTGEACQSFWVEAHNLLGGGYTASGVSDTAGNARVQADLDQLAIDAADAIPSVRAAANRLQHRASEFMASKASGQAEFLAFTHAIGDMGGACTDAGHPAPAP